METTLGTPKPGSTKDYKQRDALDYFYYRSVVGFCVDPPKMLGSGTLIAVGRHVVVATAGHVAAYVGNHLGTTRMLAEPIVNVHGSERFTEFPGFLGGFAPMTHHFPEDVGVVTLTDPIADILRERAVPLNCLAGQVGPDQLATQPTRAIGFPASLLAERGPDRVVRSLNMYTAVHHPCDHAHIASQENGIPLDYGIHVDWSGYRDPADGEVKANPDPHGMSGGPLWTLKPDQDGVVWAPERHCRLVGIIFFWDSPHCLRAAPILDWLVFLRDIGSAFREDIDAVLHP
jgi:hypothetical protein